MELSAEELWLMADVRNPQKRVERHVVETRCTPQVPNLLPPTIDVGLSSTSGRRGDAQADAASRFSHSAVIGDEGSESAGEGLGRRDVDGVEAP